MKRMKEKADLTQKVILKHVLKNALDFNGSINDKAVLGQVLREKAELKDDIPTLLKQISIAAKEVKGLSVEEIRKRLEKEFSEFLKKDQKEQKQKVEGPLKELPNASKGKVIVRIAPSPSGALHIGHAYGASLNYEYAKMYNGRIIVRIEDTNPENIYDQAYELIEKDSQWLMENKVSDFFIQSDRLGIYYDYAEKLVNMGKAYVCTINPDKWREMKARGEPSPFRELPIAEQQKRYAKMFSTYGEGEAVLRLKTDMQHKNPAMRDFGLMRINKHVHPKTGKEHKVWPLMVFSVAIDDHEMGVTHVLNGKDHTDNAAKEMMIMDCFGWKHPEYRHWGMINFLGMHLSTTETKRAIEHEEYHGWDDVRLPFLPALRRRGYQPGAFRKFAVEIGLSMNDKTVEKEEFWKMINSFNREIIEPKASRFFFVDDPIGIKINKAPEKEVEIDLHPDDKKKGKRKMHGQGDILISKTDYKRIGEGYIHRLMDYCNFELKGEQFNYISGGYEEYRNAKNKGQIIHWLPKDENIDVEVVFDNGMEIFGKGEKGMLDLNERETVQLERRYFATLDKKEKKKLKFVYLHK